VVRETTTPQSTTESTTTQTTTDSTTPSETTTKATTTQTNTDSTTPSETTTECTQHKQVVVGSVVVFDGVVESVVVVNYVMFVLVVGIKSEKYIYLIINEGIGKYLHERIIS
jgi:hypothetical protein